MAIPPDFTFGPRYLQKIVISDLKKRRILRTLIDITFDWLDQIYDPLLVLFYYILYSEILVIGMKNSLKIFRDPYYHCLFYRSK